MTESTTKSEGPKRPRVPGSHQTDTEVLGKPIFGPIEADHLYGMDVFVQRGLYVNPQGKLFLMEVIGSHREISHKAIDRYTREVRVQLNWGLLGEPTRVEDLEPSFESPETKWSSDQFVVDLLQENPESLLILIDFRGILSRWRAIPTEQGQQQLKSQIDEVPSHEWTKALQASELALITPRSLVPSVLYEGPFEQAYVLETLIDPTIASGASHNYRAKCVKVGEVKLDVSGGAGGGSVKATLTRNGEEEDTLEVSKGGTETDYYKSTASTTKQLYDLVVKDVVSDSRTSVYEVRNTWNCYYGSSAPAGGGPTSCTT